MKRIYLVGMPGSGKSTSGKRFAKAMVWGFADLDKLIQLRSGKSIPAIFEEQGEAAFRELEQQCLYETAASQFLVVACGGGTAAWADNMDWMLQQGLVIWLDISAAELKRRILEGRSERPLFKGLDELQTEARLSSLLHQREAFFKRANHRVNSEKALLELAFMLSQDLAAR